MRELEVFPVMTEATNHWVRVLPAVGIVTLLFLAMSGANAMMMPGLMRDVGSGETAYFFGFICFSWTISLTVYGLSVAVLLRALHGKSGDMVGTFIVALVKYVIVMIGSMFCVIPGIYAMCAFSLAEVLAFRGHGLSSLSMSNTKIDGNKVGVLIIYILVMVVWMVVVGGLMFAVTAVAGSQMLAMADITSPQYWVYNVVQSGLGAMMLSYLYCVVYEIALSLEDGRLSDDMVDVFS